MSGWLAQNLDPLAYGLGGWIVIAVAFSALVGWGAGGIGSLWIRAHGRRTARRFRKRLEWSPPTKPSSRLLDSPRAQSGKEA